MKTWNFVWPAARLSPDYENRIEAALNQFLKNTASEELSCHDGVVEVCIAEGMPLGRPVNAVLVCACGAPWAALEGRHDGYASWDLAPLGKQAVLPSSH